MFNSDGSQIHFGCPWAGFNRGATPFEPPGLSVSSAWPRYTFHSLVTNIGCLCIGSSLSPRETGDVVGALASVKHYPFTMVFHCFPLTSPHPYAVSTLTLEVEGPLVLEAIVGGVCHCSWHHSPRPLQQACLLRGPRAHSSKYRKLVQDKNCWQLLACPPLGPIRGGCQRESPSVTSLPSIQAAEPLVLPLDRLPFACYQQRIV